MQPSQLFVQFILLTFQTGTHSLILAVGEIQLIVTNHYITTVTVLLCALILVFMTSFAKMCGH